MKIKTIKYNQNGLSRAENTAPKFVMPKNDLTKSNTKIVTNNHYITVTKKELNEYLTNTYETKEKWRKILN